MIVSIGAAELKEAQCCLVNREMPQTPPPWANSSRIGSFILCAVATLLSSSARGGVDRIKADNTNNLNLPSSWTGSATPDIYNMAVWTNTVTGANSTVLGGNVTWNGIRIANPGGAVTIGAGNTLTLSAGQAGTSIDMSAATQDFTIQSGLTIRTAVGQLWNIASGRTLTLNTGPFTRGAGATLNVQGTGTVNATTITNGATGIIGPWATFGTGTSARYAMLDGSNNIVAYTGGTAAATAASVTDTTGLVNYDVAAVGTLGAGASFNTLRYTGAAGTITGNFTANGILTAGTGALTLSGNVTIGSGGELVLSNGDSNSARFLTLSGSISDGAAGSSALTKGGFGTVTLSGSNTYTGLTTISRGNLAISNNNALGSSAGGTRIGLSGRLILNGGMTSAESIWLDDVTNAFNNGTVLQNIGTNTLTGAIRVSPSTRWQSSGTLNVTGGISTTGGHTGTGLVLQAADTMNITGKPLSLGAGNLYMDVFRTIVLGVQGSSYGSHSLYGGTLRAGAANVFSSAAEVNFSVFYAATASTLDLNGYDQTVGNIKTGNFSVHGSFDRVITSATAATLTAGATNTNTTFDGRLAGAVSLTKVGSGTLTLTGSSTTTGGLTVNQGTVLLNFARATASQSGAGTVSNYLPSTMPLTLGGGTFQLTGRNNGTATSLTGASWSASSSLITVSSTANLAPGQLITGGSGLPAGAYVVSILSGTQFVINAVTTAAQASTTISATANSFTTSQSFAGLTLNAGASGVTVSANSADGTVLNLGDITVNPGASVNFTLPSGTQDATNGITANNMNTNGILGGWARVGNNWATNSTNAADGNIVEFTAYTNVNRLGGTVTSDATKNVQIIDGGSSGDVTPAASGTTDIYTLRQATVGNDVIYNPGTTDVLRLGAVGGILVTDYAGSLSIGASINDGVLTAGGADNTAGTLYLTDNRATELLRVNSTIADNGTGVVSVTIFSADDSSGLGGVQLSGTNTYTGRTTVGGGTLRISSEANLGANPDSFVADQLLLAGGRLNATANFTIDDANRGITLGPAGGTILVNSVNTLTVANVIDGTGRLLISGFGILELKAANTFSGQTQLAYGTLRLGHVDALQNSTLNFFFTNGQVNFTAAGTNTYNLGGLAGNDSVSLGANSLSVGANNETTTFSGTLSGTGGLTKVGAGTLNLTTAQTYSGDTRIEGGMIVLAHANALQNSTLDTGPAGTQSANLTLGEGTTYNIGGLKGSADLDLAVSHLSVGANNQSTVFSGSLLGAFNNNVTKVGTGTLTFAGNNTYTGTTTVSAGSLQVGQGGVGQTGLGEVTVQNGASMYGTGVIQGHNFTAASGSTVQAGDSTATNSFGTLNFTPVAGGGTHSLQGDILLGIGTANNTGAIDPTYGGNTVGSAGYISYVNNVARSQGLGSGSHDLLSFNASGNAIPYTLTVSGNIQVTASGFTPEIGQIFNLLDWSGADVTDFTGFAVGTNYRDGSGDDATQFNLPTLSSGLFWDVSQFTTSGIIVVVPEPSRMLLWMLGLAGIIARRRRGRC